METELSLNKDIANIIVAVCTDVKEFSRLYKQEVPNNASNIFNCNNDIIKGIEWISDSKSTDELIKNIESFLKKINFTVLVYKNIHLPFENKSELLSSLFKLELHLNNLLEQFNKN